MVAMKRTAWPCSVGLVLALALTLATPLAQAAKKKPKQAAAAKAPGANSGPLYGTSESVRSFATEIAERRNLPLAWVLANLAQARRIDRVRQLVMPPPAGTAKDWQAYRARFLDSQRIQGGLNFWRDNEATLQQAQSRYGVPAEMVVAIIGVETFYGRITGGYRVMDALATLSFDFPSGRKDRAPFFKSELEEFLALCHREGLDPLSVKGSYAGAMGLPQFMPSSIAKYAVDFDGDGHVHLHSNTQDVIGSVANYFASFGWQPGMPTHYPVRAPVDTTARATLLGPDIKPTFSAAQFGELGAELSDMGRGHSGPLALVELQNGAAAPTFVAGTENFYVVTRYNWSSYYAMAVIELAQALKNGRQ
jgi:membrane-bound lytic murein transglycosylase B